MSNYVSDIACPGCGNPHLYASDESRRFGYHNPYVLVCAKPPAGCGKQWRYTDSGELKLVEYKGMEAQHD